MVTSGEFRSSSNQGMLLGVMRGGTKAAGTAALHMRHIRGSSRFDTAITSCGSETSEVLGSSVVLLSIRLVAAAAVLRYFKMALYELCRLCVVEEAEPLSLYYSSRFLHLVVVCGRVACCVATRSTC